MEDKYKKFIDNGNGDCIYCHERSHDCCCGENTAKELGYHYEHIKKTVPLQKVPMPSGLKPVEEMLFLLRNPTSKIEHVGVWRKGKVWFKSTDDLVDHYNKLSPDPD